MIGNPIIINELINEIKENMKHLNINNNNIINSNNNSNNNTNENEITVMQTQMQMQMQYTILINDITDKQTQLKQLNDNYYYYCNQT